MRRRGRSDATGRAIALARTFGTRGRVLIPPEDLGPKGDLNDWLRVGAKGDPASFHSILERALATSTTPWALQIQRLPQDLAPWDLEDHPDVRDLLCELGHQGPLSRDAHLRLLAERYGVALATLEEAARDLAQTRMPSRRRRLLSPSHQDGISTLITSTSTVVTGSGTGSAGEHAVPRTQALLEGSKFGCPRH
jgi:hypothetical protein